MLHPVPDSTERARLLEVVELQRQLMEALCALAVGAVVDQAWLQGVWPALEAEWVRRFWNLPKDTALANQPGKRSLWVATIAAATAADKLAIRDLLAEQLRFAELYHIPPTVRLTAHGWNTPVFAAVNKLLKSFYDPLFYEGEGFPNPDGTRFHKAQFINPRPRICPYTDNAIQDTKLDHFLPKDQFPMLSCHPDNLIPCSTDANSGSHKGTKAPLDLDVADQTGAWFHPRWRSARDTYRLTFAPGPAPQPSVQFVALAAHDQSRLDNMERMFGLSAFWGGFLDDEVQNIASDVDGLLRFDNLPPTQANVLSRLSLMADQARRRIGRDAFGIVKSSFYEHIAQTRVLLTQIVRTCEQGSS